MAHHFKRLRKLRLHHHGLLILILSLAAAYFVPGVGEDPAIRTILSFVGVLFGLVTGFSLNHLFGRYREVRSFVAKETGGLINYYHMARALGQYRKHKKWSERQATLIDTYIVAWIPEEWHDYHKGDVHWMALRDSINELAGKIEKGMQNQIYSRMLQTLMTITEAREELNILGKNRLSKEMVGVLLLLGSIFLFALFYLKTPTVTSIVFTGMLATVVLVMLLAIRDLDYLRFGEEVVSFEPYERVLDAIGKPRFYPKELVEAGRIHLAPKEKSHRFI